MLKFPAPGHVLNDEIDPLFIADQWRRMPSFPDAVRSARAHMERDGALVKSVNTLCLRANGHIWLIRVTPAAWSKRWDFGNPMQSNLGEQPFN